MYEQSLSGCGKFTDHILIGILQQLLFYSKLLPELANLCMGKIIFLATYRHEKCIIVWFALDK